MLRIRRYRGSFVVALALLRLMLVGTFSARACAVPGNAGITRPELTAAVGADGASGAITVTGRGFTPGGRVYVALYDVWGAKLYGKRWTYASAAAYGPNGSQDPAAGYVAGSHRWSDDRRHRGHERTPYPSAEQLERVTANDPAVLLRELEGAIRENDQFRAAAIVQRYGEQGHASRPVFDVLLRYAISEDGRLHGEKYYRTAMEEFTSMRPAER